MVLSGDESNIGRYAFGNKIEAKMFCKICGVNMTNGRNRLSSEQVAMLSPMAQQIYNMPDDCTPVNACVLNEVDLSELKIKYEDEETSGREPYTNP